MNQAIKKTRGRYKKNYSEGDCFVFQLENGNYARGVIARCNGKISGQVLSYFFLPSYENMEEAVIDDYLIPNNAIYVAFHTDTGLINNEWKVIGKISPWIRESWSVPVFGFVDITIPWGERRYYDDNSLLHCRTKRVSLDNITNDVLNLPDDGYLGYEYLQFTISTLIDDLANKLTFLKGKYYPPTEEQQKIIKESLIPNKFLLRNVPTESSLREVDEYFEANLKEAKTSNKKTKISKEDKKNNNPIQKPLQKILNRLDTIAEKHGEVQDTDVRDLLHKSVWDGFIMLKKKYQLPDSFAMFSRAGNKKVDNAIKNFLDIVREIVKENPELKNEKNRLDAFQDITITSKSNNNTYDEYFGHIDDLETLKNTYEELENWNVKRRTEKSGNSAFKNFPVNSNLKNS